MQDVPSYLAGYEDRMAQGGLPAPGNASARTNALPSRVHQFVLSISRLVRPVAANGAGIISRCDGRHRTNRTHRPAAHHADRQRGALAGGSDHAGRRRGRRRADLSSGSPDPFADDKLVDRRAVAVGSRAGRVSSEIGCPASFFWGAVPLAVARRLSPRPAGTVCAGGSRFLAGDVSQPGRSANRRGRGAAHVVGSGPLPSAKSEPRCDTQIGEPESERPPPAGEFPCCSSGCSAASICCRCGDWNFRNHAAFYDHYTRTYWKWLLVNPIELIFAVGAP